MTRAWPEKFEVGIIGAGAWGTALAIHCARKGMNTLMWAYEADTVQAIEDTQQNLTFLPGVNLPSNLRATNDLQKCVQSAHILLTVIPTPHVARIAKQISPWLTDDHAIVSCSKGIDNESLETVNEIFERVLPRRFHLSLAYLSGPSFAAEVAAGSPTAVTIAALDRKLAHHLQKELSNDRLRCYATNDVIGVEMGGALKNVMAIATGAADGLGFGFNARAALITRGLSEITRVAVKKGGNPLTMQGLAGMGDLVLTCTGDLSRNRTVGLRLGRGESIEQILGSMSAVAEGVLTSRSAHRLCEQLGVDAPIIHNTYRVVHEGLPPLEALASLMSRSLKDELTL